jgi:hypothetical protein
VGDERRAERLLFALGLEEALFCKTRILGINFDPDVSAS